MWSLARWWPLVLLGCYLSHPAGVELGPEDAGPPADPCEVLELCGCEWIAHRRGDPVPFEPDPCGWCCAEARSFRAVLVDDECVLDVDACLPHEEVQPVLPVARLAEAPARELITLEGTVVAAAGRSGEWPTLDGTVALIGAPCGNAFGCSSGSCSPVAEGRRARVTGWFLGEVVCTRTEGAAPYELEVVSWAELP
jgi:hypothetical protein